MKTAIDIPIRLLRKVVRHTGAKSERAAVVAAIIEFNRLRPLNKIPGVA